MVVEGARCSRYDPLYGWARTQDAILDTLRTGPRDKGTTLPHGLQLLTSLNHRSPMKCLATLKGTTGDLFITHSSQGAAHVLQAWTMKYGTRQVHTVKCEVPTGITKLVFIPTHRVFVGYCTDLTLRVFSDVVHQFAEISVTLCPSTILCLGYNKEQDELVTGGVGCLLRWSMADYRDGLVETEPYNMNIEQDEWVQELQFDYKSRQLMVQSDNSIHFINYTTGDQIHHFLNHHSLSLTSAVTYRPQDYFMTASRDGSIKVWNTIVFEQMYEYRGHYDAVTGMVMHPTQPLLVSSSLDGSIRMWRLDTFELLQRIDMGEPILALRMINSQEIAYFTETAVRVWRLNMYHSLFCEVQSAVETMSRVTWRSDPARLLISTQDGGVRLLSPRTGATLTVVYPLATQKVIADILYDPLEQRVYLVLSDRGEALVFSTSTNPSQLLHRIAPPSPDKNIVALAVISRDNHLDKVDQDENLIFAGHMDGTISLLHAGRSRMRDSIQAHNEPVSMLGTSRGVRRYGTPLVGCYDRLVSASLRGTLKVWEVQQADISGAITLLPLAKIVSSGCPHQMSMLANVIAFSVVDKGILHIYRINDAPVENQGCVVKRLKHEIEDDHTQEINGLDCCPGLGLFGSSGDDGFIKIWSNDGELIREISLDNSLRSLCFGNAFGDIIFGYQNHLYAIKVTCYLPRDRLEKIVLQDFKDDLKEDPLEFNHALSLTLDYSEVPTLPLDREDRLWFGSPVSKYSSVDLDMSYSAQETTKHYRRLSRNESIDYILHKRPSHLSASHRDKGLPAITEGKRKKNDDLQTTAKDQDQPPSNPDEGEPPSDILPRDDVTEKTKPKKFYPIAPDGYIPNSVVRGLLNYKPPPDIQADRWKPKPAPKVSIDEGIGDSVSDTAFIFEQEEEEIVELDKQVTFAEELEEPEPEPEPEEPIAPLPTLKPEVKKVRQPRSAPKAPKPKSKPVKRGKKRTSFAISEEEDDYVHPLLKQITGEHWFPRNSPKTVNNVVNSFNAFMGIVEESVHTDICHYIVKIHRENDLGYNDAQRKKIVDKVRGFLAHSNPGHKINAIRTLVELGVDDFKTIMELIGLLCNEDENVRIEAARALKLLAGIDNKDKLLHVFKDMGVLPDGDSRQDERETLAALAESRPGDEDEELVEKVESWMRGAVDEEEEPPERVRPPKQPEPERKRKAPSVRIPDQYTDVSAEVEKPKVKEKERRIPPKVKLLPNNPALFKAYKHQASNYPKVEGDRGQVQAHSETGTRLPAIGKKGQVNIDDRYERDTGIGTDRDSDVASTFGTTSFESSLPPLLHSDDTSVVDSAIHSDDHMSQRGMSMVQRGGPKLAPIKSRGTLFADEKNAGHTENWRDLLDQASARQPEPMTKNRQLQLRDDLSVVDSSIHSDDRLSQRRTSMVQRGGPKLAPIRSRGTLFSDEQNAEKCGDLFDHPSARQRGQMAKNREGDPERRRRAGTVLPPIQYHGDREVVIPPEPGVRLVHSIYVKDKVEQLQPMPPANKTILVQNVPSKLSVHTASLPYGQSQYGLLNMQWTTCMGRAKADVPQGPRKRAPSYIQGNRSLPSGQPSSVSSTPFLPDVMDMGSQRKRPTKFVWQQPLPPQPHGSRLQINELRQNHKHYCEYYRLLKKGMNTHISRTSPRPAVREITARRLTESGLSLVGGYDPWARLSSMTLNLMLGPKS